MGAFGLNLHPEKTRFDRVRVAVSAARRSSGGSAGKCETFDFLGFIAMRGVERPDEEIVSTWCGSRMAKRMTGTLAAFKEQL